MLNLIKYEFRKTWALKGIILVITAIFEAMFLIGMLVDSDNMTGLSVCLLCLETMFGVFIIGVFGVYTLSKDLNTKRSYMLFMTPNSSYKILGAKLIENATSIFLGGIFFIVLGIADITALLSYSGELSTFVDIMVEVFNLAEMDSTYIFVSGIHSLSWWAYIVVVGFFAVIISSSLLNGRKYNGLISFILFLFIAITVSKIHTALIIAIFRDVFDFSLTRIIFGIFYYVMLSIIMYVISAWIMDNKLSV